MKLTAPIPSLQRFGAGIALVIAALFFLPGLGQMVVQREQELRVALTARSMAEGGNWLVPDYLGQMRLRKPPLMYWVTAVAYRWGGATDSAWLARLPSALAGIGLSLLIFLIGRKAFGTRQGLFAAVVCSTTLIILRQGRLAETDVMLTFWVTLATWSGYRAMREPRGLTWTLLAAFASGLGFLTKGPAAFALPLLAWITLVLCRGRNVAQTVSTASITLRLTFWFIIASLIALPWYLYLVNQVGSIAQLRMELSATFGEATRHPGPWYYYSYTALLALAPWSLIIPPAFMRAGRVSRSRIAPRFLLIWFITSFLALSFTSSKQIHYCALLAPSASLLVGWHASIVLRRRVRWARIAARWAVPLLLAGWGLHLLAVYVILPNHEPKQALLAALMECRHETRNATRVFLVGRHRATIEFHAGRPILDMDSIKEAWRQSKTGDLIVLNTREHTPFQAPGPVEVIARTERQRLRCEIWRRL